MLVGLPSIRTEIYAGLADVALAIRGELASMMGLESFVDAIPGHFDGHAAGQERARRVIAWLRTLG